MNVGFTCGQFRVSLGGAGLTEVLNMYWMCCGPWWCTPVVVAWYCCKWEDRGWECLVKCVGFNQKTGSSGLE